VRRDKIYIDDGTKVRKAYGVEELYAEEFRKRLGEYFTLSMPYECKICKCNFMFRADLKDHEPIHNLFK